MEDIIWFATAVSHTWKFEFLTFRIQNEYQMIQIECSN